jgi:hypothetical protein
MKTWLGGAGVQPSTDERPVGILVGLLRICRVCLNAACEDGVKELSRQQVAVASSRRLMVATRDAIGD